MMPFLSAGGTSFHVTKTLLKVVSINCKFRGDALGPKRKTAKKLERMLSNIQFYFFSNLPFFSVSVSGVHVKLWMPYDPR